MVVEHPGARVAHMTRVPFRSYAVRLAVMLLIAAAAACSSTGKRPPAGALEPDKFLFEKGTEALTKKRWLSAREFFRTLMDSYPQSSYRAEAKLGIGDSYLGEKTEASYVLAIGEFREFLAYYPVNKKADYAQFKLAMSHFNQMRGPERDQTETREAIQEFQTFLQRYPPLGGDDADARRRKELIDETQQRLREARDRLGDHDYRVGLFYYRSRMSIPGAIDRFLTVLKNDPQYTHRDAVYYYLAQSLVLIQQPAAALPYLDKLITEFSESEFLEPAKKQAEELKAQMAKKTGGVSGK
jgi:outer membrane protein assembly factor BamD